MGRMDKYQTTDDRIDDERMTGTDGHAGQGGWTRMASVVGDGHGRRWRRTSDERVAEELSKRP